MFFVCLFLFKNILNNSCGLRLSLLQIGNDFRLVFGIQRLNSGSASDLSPTDQSGKEGNNFFNI